MVELNDLTYEYLLDTTEDNLILVSSNTNSLQQVAPDADADEQKLKDLLGKFELQILFDSLKAANVTFRSLQYMNKEDIKEAVPHLGLRAEFREKLFFWKKIEFGIDDDTMSVPTKVEDWLQNYY